MTDQAHGQRVRHCSTFMGPTCPYGDLCSTGCRRLVAQSGETFTLTRPVPAPVGLEREEIARAIDSPTVAALAALFAEPQSILTKSYSEQIAEILAPRFALSPDHRTEPASAPIGQAEVKDDGR